MKDPLFSREALTRIRHIHALSNEFNTHKGQNHPKRLVELMEHHIREIPELLSRKDPHALVETGDLMVLCLEMLLEYKKDVNHILELCLARYERKLPALLRQANQN